MKLKKFFNWFIIMAVVLSCLPSTPTLAGDPPLPDLTAVYFNNAINSDPTELGNYWLDPELTVHADTLPDFENYAITVVAGATYTGDITIRSNATNEGTITGNASFKESAINNGAVNGNATFFEDQSENHGSVTGTKTRYYTIDTSTERNYITGGPWTVIADGAIVSLNGRDQSDGTTIFGILNEGSFNGEDCDFTATYFSGNQAYINFSGHLNFLSVPDPSDFSVLVDGTPATILTVTITGKRATLGLSAPLSGTSQISISYTPGDQPLTSIANTALPPISNETAFFGLPVEEAPVYALGVGDKLYVSNNHSSSITVINTKTNEVIKRIPAGDYPEFSWVVGHKIYTTNRQSADVTVIDTDTDTLIGSIEVGFDPYFSTLVGTKLYVSVLGTGKVAVIDTQTDTVVAQITVGTTPFFGTSIGNKVYIPNSGSGTVSVIDSTTDTVTATIETGGNPVFAARIGTKVYVTGSVITVIDSLTDTVITTLTAEGMSSPHFSAVIGKKLYVPNWGGNTVNVVDSDTDTITTTLTVGAGPFSITVYGDKAYVNNQGGASVSVIDSLTDTVIETIPVGVGPFYSSIGKQNLYVSNNESSSVAIIPTDDTPRLQPNLISFATTAPDGKYSQGQGIPIIAQFGHTLRAGSTMTVRLNTGVDVTLDTIVGSTLRGMYTIGAEDTTPDLAVETILNGDVSDNRGNTNLEYGLPSSQGDFTGENSFITRNLGDTHNITIGNYKSIAVGNNPYQISSAITIGGQQYTYVANQGSNTVSVLRLTDNTVVATIAVGQEPYGLTVVTVSGTKYIYVANTLSNTVSVINTATNTVTATISVGVKPYYVEHIGTNVYVTNGQSNTVSVIDGTNNTVTATIPVGNYPRGIKAHGTDLYVANYGDQNYSGGDTISVIDSLTNNMSDTIILSGDAHGPRGVSVSGDRVYVTNYRSHSLTIINAQNNTIEAVVPVGRGPRGVVATESKIYVENFDDGTISIIDKESREIIDTIDVGHSPAGMSVIGNDIYYTRFQDNKVSLLNTLTSTLETEDATAPLFSNITAQPSLDNAIISWTTDEDASAKVQYGFTTDYGAITDESDLAPRTTTHTLTLLSLNPGRTYHFRVISTDAFGNTRVSDDYIFTTASLPISGGGGGFFAGKNPEQPPVSTPIVMPVKNLPPPKVKTPVPVKIIKKNPFNKNLKKGDTGAEVKRLQEFLVAQKYFKKKDVIGIFGNLTKQAVIRFQKANKVKPESGYFGPLTRAKANSLLK